MVSATGWGMPLSGRSWISIPGWEFNSRITALSFLGFFGFFISISTPAKLMPITLTALMASFRRSGWMVLFVTVLESAPVVMLAFLRSLTTIPV